MKIFEFGFKPPSFAEKPDYLHCYIDLIAISIDRSQQHLIVIKIGIRVH